MLNLNNIDKLFQQYAGKTDPIYKTPNQILNDLSEEYQVKEDLSTNAIARKNIYDAIENQKGCKNVNSKIFTISLPKTLKGYAYVYINFSNDYIQVDGSQELACKIILLRGLRPNEVYNKYYLYNYMLALQYFGLLNFDE